MDLTSEERDEVAAINVLHELDVRINGLNRDMCHCGLVAKVVLNALNVGEQRQKAYRAGREDAARDIERPGSILCSCSDCDNPPTNWKTRARMDHHCDCAAVEAAATMLGAYSKTNHAQQCVHGTEFDEYYQADQPRTVSPGEQGDNPEEQR